MKNVSSRFGFSLLEIMVVIGIISILASVLYVNFSDARQSSRDRALMAEIRDMQLALELYKEQNGSYPPIPACGSGGARQIALDSACGGDGSYIAEMVPDFISSLPQASDSANPGCDIEYKRFADGSWYKLSANNCLHNQLSTSDSEMALCSSTCTNTSPFQDCEVNTEFGQSIAIYSFEGQCE